MSLSMSLSSRACLAWRLSSVFRPDIMSEDFLWCLCASVWNILIAPWAGSYEQSGSDVTPLGRQGWNIGRTMHGARLAHLSMWMLPSGWKFTFYDSRWFWTSGGRPPWVLHQHQAVLSRILSLRAKAWRSALCSIIAFSVFFRHYHQLSLGFGESLTLQFRLHLWHLCSSVCAFPQGDKRPYNYKMLHKCIM